MIQFLVNIFKSIWHNILMRFNTPPLALPSNEMEVFVRTNVGEQVAVKLDSSWTVSQIKDELSVPLNISKEQLRIIFAGKELEDSLDIAQCDLGNHSVLHAVRIHDKNRKQEEVHSSHEKGLAADSSLPLQSSQPSCTLPENHCVPVIRKSSLLCDPSAVITIQLTEAEQQQLKDVKTLAKERPYFYVYCVQPCSSVQIGKLRVRCERCKGGALTVHRDPASWNDVLLKNQIKADCESQGCGETLAEFYFKCKGHETLGENDTAVPLHLVRTNLPRVPCLACTDVSSPVVVFQCRSAHTVCLDCFVTYCVSRLNERQFVHNPLIGYTLPCPAGCQNSLINEVHHFKLMGKNHYEQYQRWSTEEAVIAAGGVFCPRPDCGQGIIPDEGCQRVICLNGCGYVFCAKCLQGFHIGDCETAATFGAGSSESHFTVDPLRASHSRFDEASNITIRTVTKPCPKCRTATERDGGCMHMVCTRGNCGFHWCWVCQTEWTRDCMGAHWFG